MLLFVCLACPWLALLLLLRTLADTALLHGCWLINIRDSVSSLISLYCRTNHFTLFQSFFHQSFFNPPPLGLVTHFLLLSTLFTYLTSFSQLASLPVCSLCGLCCLCCWVSWTDAGVDVVLLYSHRQHHTQTQATST
jgi:hypothetical protein